MSRPISTIQHRADELSNLVLAMQQAANAESFGTVASILGQMSGHMGKIVECLHDADKASADLAMKEIADTKYDCWSFLGKIKEETEAKPTADGGELADGPQESKRRKGRSGSASDN